MATEEDQKVVLPLNRFIAFIKPWLNILAGAVAAWLVAKANVLGLPGLDQENTATWLAGAFAWAITTGLTQLGDLKWLRGHHIEIAANAEVQAAAMRSSSNGLDDPAVEKAPSTVSDRDELSLPPPPPDASNVPIQPSQDPELRPIKDDPQA